MVSLRCKILVKAALEALGISYASVDLGAVELAEPLSAEQENALRSSLKSIGLELLDDKKSILIEKIKIVIIEMIHYTDELPTVNYSDYISMKLNYDYNYLSNIFSEVKGTTIRNFINMHKIEKVKELLLYDELNLTEIACKLHFSSVAHLSSQFKKITGLTPSYFKKLRRIRESNLEDL